MLLSELRHVVQQVSRDKGIDINVLFKTLQEAIASAARKKLGSRSDIEVHLNEDDDEIEVFQFREVVEEVEDPEVEISIEEGRLLDPECELGDSLGAKVDTSSFGRIAAQSAKQVIIQKMKDAERSAVYENYIDREGEIINGIVQRIDRNEIIVNLGHTQGVLPVREQMPRENYRRGDRVRAFILKVLQDSRGPQIILTRTHPGFLINLFRTEVPEISEGIVEIMGASREPGSRSKIAVSSRNSDIDPVGACVGMRGSRVQSVVQELHGEKIDIIQWHPDIAKYVCNALAPAEITRVIIDEENRSMEVIVPDEFLSVAIGKRGQNVRLASKLTGWHLDVRNEADYSSSVEDGLDALMNLPGVNGEIAGILFESGFTSLEILSSASGEELAATSDLVDQELAEKLPELAQEALDRMDDEEFDTENEDSFAEPEAEQDSGSDADMTSTDDLDTDNFNEEEFTPEDADSFSEPENTDDPDNDQPGDEEIDDPVNQEETDTE